METEIRLTRGIYIAAYVLLGYGVAVLTAAGLGTDSCGSHRRRRTLGTPGSGVLWGNLGAGHLRFCRHRGEGISSSGGLTTGGTGRGTGWSDRDKISPAFAGGAGRLPMPRVLGNWNAWHCPVRRN